MTERDRNDLWLKVNMTCDLTLLTLETGASHDPDLMTHVRPAKTSTEETGRSLNTRVVDAMEGVKHKLSELNWHQQPKNAGGNVSKEWKTVDIPGENF